MWDNIFNDFLPKQSRLIFNKTTPNYDQPAQGTLKFKMEEYVLNSIVDNYP